MFVSFGKMVILNRSLQEIQKSTAFSEELTKLFKLMEIDLSHGGKL
jgi:hypothetical protein